MSMGTWCCSIGIAISIEYIAEVYKTMSSSIQIRNMSGILVEENSQPSGIMRTSRVLSNY